MQWHKPGGAAEQGQKNSLGMNRRTSENRNVVFYYSCVFLFVAEIFFSLPMQSPFIKVGCCKKGGLVCEVLILLGFAFLGGQGG